MEIISSTASDDDAAVAAGDEIVVFVWCEAQNVTVGEERCVGFGGDDAAANSSDADDFGFVFW